MSESSNVTIGLVIVFMGIVYAVGIYVGQTRARHKHTEQRLDSIEKEMVSVKKRVDDIFSFLTNGGLKKNAKT